MSASIYLGDALLAVLLLAVLVLGYRLWKMRQGGTAAILRDLPASGGHGWRHGVIRYRDDEAASTGCPVCGCGRTAGWSGVRWRSPTGGRRAATSSTS